MNMDQHINVEDICRKEINFNNVQPVNKKINKEKYLILCVNIRSINENFEKLEILIESLYIKPSVIVCTEAWKVK